MKLFQRIFATFCMVIFCAIFVASFSFWVYQTRQAENDFKQTRDMETSLLTNAVVAFESHGEDGVYELLERWKSHPASKNVLVITGDNQVDLFKRPINPKEIEHAYDFALKNPNSNLARVSYDPFGEEYLFFIRHFENNDIDRLPNPLLIPGLSIAPIWHEVIILSATIIIGLLLAYILANNITQPIRVLGHGMNRLALGELDARVSQQLYGRKDELAHLGIQFDKMADQLQKLVEKERHLLHHVSHEMRSPLARIQAIVDLIRVQPKKQADYLARLENELNRMDTLVGELLTLSRLETSNVPLDKEELALLPFIRNLLEDSQTVAEQLEHHIGLEAENIDENARFYANESYFYRALDNVIRNAMKYSPNGSNIKIRLYETRQNLHIDICDNGPGIKEEQLPHIFTAFYRADSSGNKPGTGLGLALAMHIAEQHGGRITAENLQPNGLKIGFILPKTHKSRDPEI